MLPRLNAEAVDFEAVSWFPKENADDGVDPPKPNFGAEGGVELLPLPNEKGDFEASGNEGEDEVVGALKPAKLDGGAGIVGGAVVEDEVEVSP